MRQRMPTSTFAFAGVFAPVISLDALNAWRDAEDGSSFDIPDEAPHPDVQLEEAEEQAAVSDFIDSLPSRDQEIVKRFFWLGETQTQIATSFGLSKMAISKAMARITKHGRIMLADHQYPTFNN